MSPAPPADGPDERLDGRARRSERSRQAIVDALVALVGSGELQPTAQQVAERAGVSLRSVFRHFRDMESLFAAMDAHLVREVTPLLEEPAGQGALAHRVAGLAQQPAELFERIAPFKRSANAQRIGSPFLRARHGELVRHLRASLRQWLPELDALPPERAAGVELITSFEAWDQLRSDQRLARRRAEATLATAVLALLGRPES